MKCLPHARQQQRRGVAGWVDSPWRQRQAQFLDRNQMILSGVSFHWRPLLLPRLGSRFTLAHRTVPAGQQTSTATHASTDHAATHHPPRPTLDWPRQSMWYTRGHASHMTTSPPSPHMMHEYSHWLPSSSAAIAESHSSSPPAAVSSAGSAAAAAAPSAFGDVTSSDPAAAAGSSGGGGSGSCTSYGIRRSAANQSSCLQGHKSCCSPGAGKALRVRALPALEVQAVRPILRRRGHVKLRL